MRSWFISHNVLLGMTACVLLMKMHSYTSINIGLRREYLLATDEEKDKFAYPKNVLSAKIYLGNR